MTTHPLVAQLTDLRRAAHLDRSVVAARIGVRPQNLQSWENGTYQPGLGRLRDWASALGCQVAVHPRAGIPLLGEVPRSLVVVRRRRGLSQTQVAEAGGMTQTQVSQWERGQNIPGLPAVTVWADALGCDLTLAPALVGVSS